MAEVDSARRRGHRRFQSVMAQQFSTQLDDLFQMDKGLDSLVTDVETKRQSVFAQQRELEELQARIKQAEARLGRSSDSEDIEEEDEDDDDDDDDDEEEEEEEDSDASDSDAVAASHAPGVIARAVGKAPHYSARHPSIFAIRETQDEEEVHKPVVAPKLTSTTAAMASQPVDPAAAPKEYVMVRRPRPNIKKHPRVDSHIDITSEEEDEEEEEDDDDDDESSEDEDSSSEEE